ncbi:MAG: site-specific integrase [Clostridiales bacterium]|nr:site-specific integrase [Clostridiales bacterium]
MLKTAVKWLILDSNPCEKVTLPKPNREMSDIEYFTPEQANIFIQALGEPYTITHKAHTRIDDTGKPYTVKEYTETRTLSKQLQLFFILAMLTGMRRSELTALTWADIDFQKNMLNIDKAAVSVEGKIINKVTKTKTSKRRVSLPDSIIPLIKEYRLEQMQLRSQLGNLWEGDNYIFIQWNGKQMHPDTATHAFRNIITRHNNSEAVKNNKALELPLIPLHGLRHTNATFLIASNKINIKTVQNHLGHANATTTLNIYAHPLEELEKSCADTIEGYIKISK